MSTPTRGKRPSISAVIIACNEADVLEPCLQSVADWVSEIVLVDMHSTDDTLAIAHRYADNISSIDRLSFADPARNAAVGRAHGEWVLILDPDERVPAALARELTAVALAGSVDVVVLPRATLMFGTCLKASGYQDDKHPRFFRRGSLSWPKEVHTVPKLDGLRVLELPRQPELLLVHHNWRSVEGAVDRIQRYAPAEVDTLIAQGEQFSTSRAVSKVANTWLDRFVMQEGYEDGVTGLLVATILTAYRAVIYMMLWERQGKPSELSARAIVWLRVLRRIILSVRAGIARARQIRRMIRRTVGV